MQQLSESQKTILENIKSLSNKLDNQVRFALEYGQDPNGCIDLALFLIKEYTETFLPKRRDDKQYLSCLDDMPYYILKKQDP